MKIKAKAIDELDHHFLSPNEVYHAISIEYDCFRIINDQGEPILYPKELFDVVDPYIPHSWVTQIDRDEDDVTYFGPPEFSRPGFFEDWHDGVKSAKDEFERYLRINGIRPNN